jgi:hypothetical protein
MGMPMATVRRGFEPVEGPAQARRPGLPIIVAAHGPGRRKDRWSAAGSRQTRASTTRGGVTPRRLGACARLGKRGASGGATSGGGPWGSGAQGGAARRAGDIAARALTFQRRTMLITPVCLSITQKLSTKVHYVMNRKVVDLTILYNFHKGSIVFFSTDFAQSAAKL